MKKQVILLAMAATVVSLLFASCNHDFGKMGTVKGDGIKVGETLTIKVDSDENIVRFENSTSKSARTIISDSFDLGTALTYYLWGTAQTGEAIDPKTVNITAVSDDNTTGKVILGIDCLNWDLTLAAVKTSDTAALGDNPSSAAIEAKAVLKANGTVDMMFTNEINFTLSPKGLSNPGTVSLKLAREPVNGTPWAIPAGYKATAYIYNITNGTPVLGGDGEDQDLSMVMYDFTNSENDKNFNYFQEAETKKDYTANGNSIKPGTYLFQVEFTSTKDKRKYVWNDTLIILPGSSFNNRTITIPNLLGTLPTTPGTLTATIFNDGDKEYPGYYTVKFDWDNDASKAIKNETNWALELIEIPDSEISEIQPTTDTGWKTLYDKATVKPVFDHAYFHSEQADTSYYDSYYKEGSLLANNYDVTMYFELGKRYVARLFAENNAGRSTNASYAVIDSRITHQNTTVFDTINMYRVTYHLQGGTWEDGDTTQTTDKIVYCNQGFVSESNPKTAVPYTVIAPNQDGSSGKPLLKNGDVKWGYWVTDISNDTKYPETSNILDPYTNFKNLDLYAVYARDGNVVVYKDSTYDIMASYVTGFGKTAGAISQDTTNTYEKGDRDAETKKFTPATLTVTLPTGDSQPTWTYDYVMFQISYGARTYYVERQEGASRGTANTFTIPMENLPTGNVYNCKIIATYNKTTVSYPFTMLITD